MTPCGTVMAPVARFPAELPFVVTLIAFVTALGIVRGLLYGALESDVSGLEVLERWRRAWPQVRQVRVLGANGNAAFAQTLQRLTTGRDCRWRLAFRE